jgi:hypothetical protein
LCAAIRPRGYHSKSQFDCVMYISSNACSVQFFPILLRLFGQEFVRGYFKRRQHNSKSQFGYVF